MPADPPVPTPAPAGALRDLLRASPRLAPDRAARLLAALARAVAAWHARAGAHGALTPERVLVGPADAVALAAPPRPDNAPAPWPTYLAPEQIDGRPGDERSDVYALGLVGWEMLAGQQPWEGESLYGVVVKQREHDLPRLSTLRPGLPRALVAAIEGCLHKAPGDRWQSAAEFLAALEPGLATAAAPSATYGAPRDGAREPAASTARPTFAPRAAGVGGAVARAAAAGAVPGAASAATPAGAGPHVDGASRAPGHDRVRAARRPTGEAGSGRRRWVAVAVLGLAVAGAAGAAVVVVQGRNTTRATQTWLDSLTTPAPGRADVGAAAATTTKENTTAVPIRRSGGAARAPEPEAEVDPEADAPPAGDVEPVEPAELPEAAPTLEPTPPLVPPRPGRPIRPTVPRATPDTIVAPEPPPRR